MKTIITRSFEETRKCGEEFAARLSGGEVITLIGDLGAGKTTFMQGLAKGLGIQRTILSPTFLIMRSYEAKYKNVRRLYHADLYRVENADSVQDIGLYEVMGDPTCIVAIEWPEKIDTLLPPNKKTVTITPLDEDTREITFA